MSVPHPADYELEKSDGVFVEQVIRPTGLLDPIIEVRPSLNQIDDLIEEIQQRVEKDERTLVTTLNQTHGGGVDQIPRTDSNSMSLYS